MKLSLWHKWRNFFLKIPLAVIRYLVLAYRTHWFATPAAAAASTVSTLGAATLMLFVSPLSHSRLSDGSAVAVNAIIATLTSYVTYLLIYYFGMYYKERRTLITTSGERCPKMFRNWLRAARYDYIAHVPSDIYLVILAGAMQASLEHQGVPIFLAVVASQFVDDLVTFFKEPAIWSGSKSVVVWENNNNSTLRQSIVRKARSIRQELVGR